MNVNGMKLCYDFVIAAAVQLSFLLQNPGFLKGSLENKLCAMCVELKKTTHTHFNVMQITIAKRYK